MTPLQQQEFRMLLLNYTKEIPEQDAQGLITAVEHIERWIDREINAAITAAVAPFVKVKTENKK